MPDVRHGCAARSSAPTAPRPHHASSRFSLCPQRSASPCSAHDDARSHPAHISSCPFACAVSTSSPSSSVARPYPRTTHPSWLAVLPVQSRPGPLVLAVVSGPSSTRPASAFGTASREAASLAVPRFTAPTASGSPGPLQRTCEAALGFPASVSGPGRPQPAPFPLGRA